MNNVIQFPIRNNTNELSNVFLSKDEALQHFNSTNLWYFIDHKDHYRTSVGSAKRTALFVPKGEQLSPSVSIERFGAIYFEEEQ